MTEHAYGSRPDYLPSFMNDPNDEDGCQVVKLGWAESRELEMVSLNRFPPTFSAALDWDASSYDSRLWWDDEDDWGRLAANLLADHVASSETIAIFWGNLLLPTVTLPAEVVVRHSTEILDVGPHFWMYPLGGSVLIECLMDGQVTVASIPHI
ncbi:hypothetical protein [Streptomyces sp. HNS054]|uniref:hypothetical protein n=1 Tax=Streptomyces sp. HNS054 TaxID=1662446 RepID=UPI000653074B|nr:hypothetical protein [Streptomyces sp. HNS054]WPW19191.1 hypothetical protein UBV09_10860 [Streptomyces griseoincarnatus]